MPVYLGLPSGPINIPEDCKTPLGFFRLLFDDFILETSVTSTNGFGTMKSGDDWEPINVVLLLHFFACLLYMGLYSAPSTREHFATKPSWAGSKFCKSMLSGRRFHSIWAHLHWINTLALSPLERENLKRTKLALM